MGSKIWIWAVGLLRSLIYFLDSVVYGFIIDLYNIFRWICGARIVDNSIMNELATRVGFILGLVMFFYISFDFIQVLLDPDKLTDKDKGPLNIIKKFLVVIVLLGTSRYIFDLMYNFQNIILSNDDGNGSIIEKLLLPYDIKSENFGTALSSQFFANFYRVNSSIEVNDTNEETEMDEYTYRECEDFANALPAVISTSGNFSLGKECLNERFIVSKSSVYLDMWILEVGEKSEDWFIDFNVLSLPVGVFVAWMLIMYCISVGMRVIQLVVLQIVSPAAIICYLSPKKENTFTKWLKVYFSTYVDVFIRIAIIDFIVLVSGLILETNNLSSDSGVVTTSGMKFWISVFMIMALLSFAKKAPDLIKKLLPDSMQSGLSFGLSAKDRPGFGMVTKAARKTAGYGVGAVGGGIVTSGISAVARARDYYNVNAGLGKTARLGKSLLAGLGGAGSGLFHGVSSGAKKGNPFANFKKGLDAQVTRNNAYRTLVEQGGSTHGKMFAKALDVIGSPRGIIDDTLINKAKKVSVPLDEVFNLAENSRAYTDLMERKNALRIQGKDAEADKIQKAADAFRDIFIEQALRGNLENLSELEYEFVVGKDENGKDIIEKGRGIVTGGDKVKGNDIYAKYVAAKAEVDQIAPVRIDENGKEGKVFVLEDAKTVNVGELDKMRKEAKKSQANVMAQEGYRAGQANKPDRPSK